MFNANACTRNVCLNNLIYHFYFILFVSHCLYLYGILYFFLSRNCRLFLTRKKKRFLMVTKFWRSIFFTYNVIYFIQVYWIINPNNWKPNGISSLIVIRRILNILVLRYKLTIHPIHFCPSSSSLLEPFWKSSRQNGALFEIQENMYLAQETVKCPMQ